MTKKQAIPWRSRQRRLVSNSAVPDQGLPFSEGALLASVPVIGTTLALLFESGFLSFYRIPLSVATLDITHIVRASLWTAVGVAAVVYMHLIMHEWDRSPSLWRRLVGSSWPWLTAPVYFVYLYPSYWWLLPCALAFMIVGTLFNAWRGRKNGKTLVENTMRILDLEREQVNSKATIRSTSASVIPFAVLLMCIATAVNHQGVRSAKKKMEYWVLKEDPTLALVERYGDNLVFTRFEPSTRHLNEEVLIKKFGDVGGLQLQLKEIGPLINLRKSGEKTGQTAK
jgi:hypothetical protein